MAVGRLRFRGRVVSLLAAFGAGLGFAADADALDQRLTAADGAANDFFGTSLAIQGDTAVVGAPLAAASGVAGAGAVYVFSRTGDTWAQTGKLTASDAATDDRLGYSVGIDGGTIVAGAPGDDGTVFEQGSVYVFTATGAANRTQTGKLIATDAAFADVLGSAVAIAGDTVAAGAPGAVPTHKGAVYTFASSGASTRNETAKLTVSGGLNFDELGYSVAIDGTRVFAGAPGYEPSIVPNTGSVFGFAASGPPARFQEARWLATDATSDDRLGFAVDARGQTLVATSVADGNNIGSAYTFVAGGGTGATQTETGKLTASDPEMNASFGASVATDDSRVLVGSWSDNAFTGSVYRFDAVGAVARNELNRVAGDSDDQLGYSVDVDGTTEAYGAPGDNIGGHQNQGSVVLTFDPKPTDTTPPQLTLTARKGKLGKAVKLVAGCDEVCKIGASGKLRVKGVKKPRLGHAGGGAAPGEPLKLKLKPSRKTVRALTRSDAEKGKAKVSVVASDGAGNSVTEQATIKLK